MSFAYKLHSWFILIIHISNIAIHISNIAIHIYEIKQYRNIIIYIIYYRFNNFQLPSKYLSNFSDLFCMAFNSMTAFMCILSTSMWSLLFFIYLISSNFLTFLANSTSQLGGYGKPTGSDAYNYCNCLSLSFWFICNKLLLKQILSIL